MSSFVTVQIHPPTFRLICYYVMITAQICVFESRGNVLFNNTIIDIYIFPTTSLEVQRIKAIRAGFIRVHVVCVYVICICGVCVYVCVCFCMCLQGRRPFLFITHINICLLCVLVHEDDDKSVNLFHWQKCLLHFLLSVMVIIDCMAAIIISIIVVLNQADESHTNESLYVPRKKYCFVTN